MRTHVARLLVPAALGGFLAGAPPARAGDPPAKQTYTFGTFVARTNITFVSEADLETIHGVCHAVSGSVEYDTATGSASGRLTVPVKDMHTGIDKRDAHMRGEEGGVWLEAAKYPEIVFEIEKTAPVKDEKNLFDFEGKLSIHGVTKAWKGRATIRFVPASVAGPAKLGDGDWVRVKTTFDVPIEEFGVKIPDGVGPKVSKAWQVTVDVYGTTAPPPAK